MATEHYQEPYTMEEPYFVEEPYSSFEGTYQEDCGTATNKMTCSRDRRVTKYHSVVKYHMVTKYRTESRQVPRPVTRYRHISHVYDLHAEEYRRSFSSTVRLSLILADDPEPIVIEQTNNELQTGLLHNDSFGPANLSPSKPKLWSHQEWFVAQVWDLRQRLDTALQERWKRRFCNKPQFTLEQAARCAFRQREVPKPVREVLDEALGVAAPPTK
jgi:hypothetical protein